MFDLRRREFITLFGGAVAWPLADRMYEGRLLAVQVIATLILFQSWTIVAAEEEAIPSDHNFVDELVSELGFQPTDLIERVGSSPTSRPKQRPNIGYVTVFRGMPTGSRLM